MRTVMRLIKLALVYKFWMLLAAFVGFLTIGSSIGLMMTSAYIIAKAALHPSIADLQVGIVGVRFFGIARGIFRYLERLISHETTFRLLARFRVWFYRALEPLAPARLMRFRSGDLLNRIISDIQTLEHFYVRVIAPPLVAVFISALMWLLLGIFNPLFSVLLLVFHLIAALAVPLLSYLYSHDLGGRILQLRTQLNVLTVDTIQGLSELQLFGQFKNHQAEFLSVEKEYRRLQTRMALITGLNESLIGLLMNGAVATMLIAAIPQVTAGTLDGVYLAVISLGIMASFEAFVPLPEALQYLDMNVRAADRLFEIIDAEPEVKDPPNPERPARNYRLTINGLSFRYSPQNDYALRNITMEVPWRQKIAVVGPSGAGKSTLINLLMRFWNYQQGTIKIGGQEIKDMAQEEVRKLFAVISQHTHLFTGTIRENLLLANPDASEQQLIRACEQAQIHRFISGLEQGYDTWIGEQGLRLSGGERQRLAIARALLKNAPILILDEATSNLDAITEEELLETLFTLSASHTVFHITHRLKKLDRMDHIYVLYQGEIIQQGTHRQLLKEEGLYRKMWEIQMQTELLEAMES